MLFNSLQFIYFFIIVTTVFFLTPPRFRWIPLLIASCYFYMVFVPVYIFILIGIILIDYYAAIAIERSYSQKKKQYVLILSLLANVGILVFFKYWNFLNESLRDLLALGNVNNPVPFLNIILPIGLSFHTFQSMAYTIEVARGNYKAEKNLGIYALYVMFYPQLVAGPIERPQGLLLQLKQNVAGFNFENFRIGITQMIYGFFKKVVVADIAGGYVDNIFNNYDINHGFTNVFAAWLFVIQVYCDFSGYSDIAIGAARIMGYKLMPNFMTPLFSKTISEYWRRWHISLSSWFRDYVFQPLSIRYRYFGKWGIMLATIITFLISGIWHGASWNFVVFGLLLGIVICLEIQFNIKSSYFNKSLPKKALGILYAFNVYAFTLIFFRSKTFDQAISFVKSIFITPVFFNLKINDSNILVSACIAIVFLLLFEFFIFRNKSVESYCRKTPFLSWTLNILLLMMIVMFGVEGGDQFIYFQF